MNFKEIFLFYILRVESNTASSLSTKYKKEGERSILHMSMKYNAYLLLSSNISQAGQG